jgi:hypothetical protein
MPEQHVLMTGLVTGESPRWRDGRLWFSDSGVRLATQDVEADHAGLRAGGFDADPDIMQMGGPAPAMFSFRDPDGNSLLIIEST